MHIWETNVEQAEYTMTNAMKYLIKLVQVFDL